MRQSKLFGSDETEVLEKIPLDVAEAIANDVLRIISEWLNPAEIVGSIRRKKSFCRDIDFVGVGSLENAVRALSKNYKTEIKVKGQKVVKLYIEVKNKKVQVDLYAATPETFGIHKLIRTGSAKHNEWLAKYAMSQGMNLRYSVGLLKKNRVVAGETEKGVFDALGLPCPEPSIREIVDGKPIWLT